jgi:hypothetical protein
MDTLISKHSRHNFRGIEKNPYELWEDQKGKYIKMFTNKGFFLFDYEDLGKIKNFTENNIIKNITWHLKFESRVKNRKAYYVRGIYKNKKKIYIHQLIMNHFGNGSNHIISVDHIDRNPLNNKKFNLRLANRSEQNSNTHKRVRGTNGCELPDEIKNIKIPKYVSYTKFKKNTKLGYRDGFIIQCHPSQKKGEKYLTTMSMKIPIKEKFEIALNKLKELNLISNKSKLRETPKVSETICLL